MSISQTYSPSARAGLVPVLLAALVCSGCLFTETAPATPSENNEENNTVVVLDEDMNTSSGDMGSEEDLGGDEEDLGTPPPPDKEEDLSCDRDEDCEGELTCIDGTCQLDTSGCEQDQDCGPMGVCNADGSCTNLVDDPENCGVKGFACPPNTFCGGGMCVCDGINPRNNFRVLATSANDGLVHYPKPQMIGYFPFQRFLCKGMPILDPSNLDCLEAEIEFNLDYPAHEPHYLLGFVADRSEIELRLVDERGDIVPGSTKEVRGNTTFGEKEIRSFRIIQNFGPTTLMLVWWHDAQAPEGKNDFVHAYSLTVRNNQIIEVTPFTGDDASSPPVRLIETSGMLDFGYATASRALPEGKTLEINALPFIHNDPAREGSDVFLELNTFAEVREGEGVTLGEYYLAAADPIFLGQPRQVLNGFDTQIRFEANHIFISTTTLEEAEGNPGINNYMTAQTHRVFRTRIDENLEVEEELSQSSDSPWQLYRHLATNAFRLYGDVVFGNDISEVPPAPLVFQGDNAANWVAMGWSRSEDRSDNKRRAILNIVGTGSDGTVTTNPTPTILENKYVYDQVLVSDLTDPTKLLMVWLEATQSPLADPERATTVQFAPLFTMPRAFPELGVQFSLNSPKIDAQRVGAQFGTRSVGVFAYGKDEIRFFAIVDNEPVCAIPGKMP